MRRAGHVKLAVVGGASLSTPILVKALHSAIAERQLPPIRLALWGRDSRRLQLIVRLCNYVLRQAEAHSSGEARSGCEISTHQQLESAVSEADFILCQVRPGGMVGRAADERLAIDAGVPGDEGIGPSGLAAFLRGRRVIDELMERCARVTPDAVVLQMTSPLGLMTAVADRHFPGRAYGVCELPAVTWARVLKVIHRTAGLADLTHSVAGLNHQSWLYAFRDRNGVDRTSEVISAVDLAELVGIEAKALATYNAIPVPYLRLYFCTQRELRRQSNDPETRGSFLAKWQDRVYDALTDFREPDLPAVLRLLSQRQMDWYEEGVVPALEALLASSPCVGVLNVRNDGAIAGIEETAILEVSCTIQSRQARPAFLPVVPAKPAALIRQLIAYERVVLALPDRPADRHLRDALELHPLVKPAIIPRLISSLTTGTTAAPSA